ncbi:MAG: hypothetical protein ACLTXP_14955, partial [Odoribacter splanchnicus]
IINGQHNKKRRHPFQTPSYIIPLLFSGQNTQPPATLHKIKVEVKIKPAAKSKIRRHLCPNKKALSDQGLL